MQHTMGVAFATQGGGMFMTGAGASASATQGGGMF
jgi:hypothetical protein